jgi:hypothetical protein
MRQYVKNQQKDKIRFALISNCTQKTTIISRDAFFVHLISFLIYDQYAIRCNEICAFS